MNENSHTVAGETPAGDAPSAEQGDDSPISSRTVREPRPTLIQRLTTVFRPRNGSTLRDDLTDALSESTYDTADFSPGERAMLHNILRLREVRVEDVMVPRADIKAVELSTTLGELLVMFEQSGHSRMPVFRETLDDPRGMIHIRDVVVYFTKVARQKKGRGSRKNGTTTPATLDLGNVDLSRTIGESNLTRPLLFVPPCMLASDLMAKMQAARTQMALEAMLDRIDPAARFMTPVNLPKDGAGVGLVEAARGALGHWLRIEGGRIAAYQIIAPTTWNFGPRDAAGTPGPVEGALVGAPVRAGEDTPVSVQHIVRSFDPCMVCTVH